MTSKHKINKIVNVVSIIHNTQPGGMQRVAALETDALNKNGYKSFLASILKTKEWSLFNELNIEPVYLFNNEMVGRFLSGIFFNIGNLKKIKPDVVIAHNNPEFQVAHNLKRKLEKEGKKVFIISYIHDSLVYSIAGSVFGKFLHVFKDQFKKLEQRNILESNIVLVNSNATMNRLLEIHKNLEDIIKKKSTILYPTTNVPITKDKLVVEKKNYLLIVGRIDHEAFYNLYKIIKNLDIPLVIAGYGHPYNPNFKKIRELFNSLKKEGKNIKFIFSPSDEELLELYRNASLFVYPGHENFNMSAIEAMSAGCPILVANTSGVCEILPHKLRDELTLDKKDIQLWVDKIKEIIENDMSYELGYECWKVTQKYNLYTHIEKFLKILNEVIK